MRLFATAKRSQETVPVEGPFEQELASSFGEAGAALVRLQDLSDHVVQPGGPLIQRALLLQGDLKILLQALDHALVTLAHPRSLLLFRHDKTHSATQTGTHGEGWQPDGRPHGQSEREETEG